MKPSEGTRPAANLDLLFASDPNTLTEVRAALRHWLFARALRPHQVEDILLACGEACSNAIEHAYADGRGNVRLLACLDETRRRLTVIVEDHGRWRERPAPGARGRGLAIIRKTMSSLDVLRTTSGTRLIMTYDITSLEQSSPNGNGLAPTSRNGSHTLD